VYAATAVGSTLVYEAFGTEIIESVVSSEEKEGVTLVVIEGKRPGIAAANSNKIRVTTAGIFRVAVGDMELDPPYCLLQLPPKPGSKWEFEIPGANGAAKTKGTSSIVGEEAVEVPAGKFKAIRVDSEFVGPDGKASQSTAWYAPGVGMVKTAYGSDRTITLKSFVLGKK